MDEKLRNYTVRIATVKDVEEISRLYEKFFKYHSLIDPYLCAAAMESGDYPRSVIEKTSGDIIIVESESNIVGFVHVEEEKTPPYPSVVQHKYCSIVDFFVLSDYRKRGFGKALFEHVKCWSLKRELDHIRLNVIENNEVGKSFYEKENFRTSSRIMIYEL